MSKEQVKEQIQALLREREGYERYGRDDRVKAVDEQLQALGHGGRPPARRATRMTRDKGTEL
jgi:hypothetical protein